MCVTTWFETLWFILWAEKSPEHLIKNRLIALVLVHGEVYFIWCGFFINGYGIVVFRVLG